MEVVKLSNILKLVLKRPISTFMLLVDVRILAGLQSFQVIA